MQDDPRFRFGFQLVTLARQWRRMLERELAAAGLTDATWVPLIHLAEGAEGCSQSALAERVGLDGSSLVRLIDLLEARGLVERRVDPADRRARHLVLTAPGRAEIAALRERLRKVEVQMLADLDDAALAPLVENLGRVEARIRAMDAPARGEA